MTLKEILEFYNRYKVKILVFGFVFSLIGVVVFFVFPPKTIATGSLFVTRKVQKDITPQDEPFFTYEGFYSQQSAFSYTSTVIGLLESEGFRSMVLGDIGFVGNADNIRRIKRAIKIKKSAPQLISVTVKEWRGVPPEIIYNSLTQKIITSSLALNEEGDPNLLVLRVEEFPIVRQTYSNVYVNALVGFGLGVFVASFALALKEYLKNA